MQETIVISLGGSLIVPEEIDVEFLKKFRDLILAQVEKGKKFVIITGGGKTCRKYQNAAKNLVDASDQNLNLIGIASLRLNAELLRVVFGDYTCEKVINYLSENLSFINPVIIGAADLPGKSTDFNAVVAAKNLGIKKVINLSNTDYAYDKDPKKYPDAKKLENISWKDYRALIPKEFTPGLSTPFDPIASKMAEESRITVMTMNGRNIENLEKCFNGEKFIGTVIS